MSGVQPRVSSTPPRPPMPRPALPNPGVCENGMRACNEPLVVNGQAVGYCDRLVWPSHLARWWRLPPGTHKGPHAVEWWAR